MFEYFHSDGRHPVESDKLKSRVIDGAIWVATSFNMTAAMPSGPVAFLVSSACSRCVTSVTEHNRSYGNSELGRIGISELSESGAMAVLKLLTKRLFSICAFS